MAGRTFGPVADDAVTNSQAFSLGWMAGRTFGAVAPTAQLMVVPLLPPAATVRHDASRRQRPPDPALHDRATCRRRGGAIRARRRLLSVVRIRGTVVRNGLAAAIRDPVGNIRASTRGHLERLHGRIGDRFGAGRSVRRSSDPAAVGLRAPGSRHRDLGFTGAGRSDVGSHHAIRAVRWRSRTGSCRAVFPDSLRHHRHRKPGFGAHRDDGRHASAADQTRGPSR